MFENCWFCMHEVVTLITIRERIFSHELYFCKHYFLFRIFFFCLFVFLMPRHEYLVLNICTLFDRLKQYVDSDLTLTRNTYIF